MKLRSMREYAAPGPPSDYEYDHLISIQLGGALDDPHNLWPEPPAPPNAKDLIERKLNMLVCSGAMMLSEAQRRISADWTTALVGFE